MASQADVRRIALSLPATEEASNHFAFDKDFLLALDPVKFFTERHYDGFPAVLARLPAVTARELRPLITEAWRCQAPKELDTKEKTPRRRMAAPRRRSSGSGA